MWKFSEDPDGCKGGGGGGGVCTVCFLLGGALNPKLEPALPQTHVPKLLNP